MKKIARYFLFLIAPYISSTAMAAECRDLNGSWRGQLGELSVGLNINGVLHANRRNFRILYDHTFLYSTSQ